MKNITIGKYIPGNSVIHKLDPRFKFVLMTGMIFLVFSASNYESLGLAATFVTAIFLLAGISFKKILKMLKPFRFMFIFLLIINLLTWKQGTVITNIGGIKDIGPVNIHSLNLYWDAIHRAVIIITRIMLMIMVSTVLTTTTKPIDLTIALEKILKQYLAIGAVALGIYLGHFTFGFELSDPLFFASAGSGLLLALIIMIKFPIMEIAMMISLALRFIPTLLEETDKIMKAQASRGADFENGKFREKVTSIITLIVPLFASAFQKAAELSDAMDSRGYVVGAKRTRYRILSIKFRDIFASVVVIGLIYCVLWGQALSPALV